jgi:YegS/Rv2252/BmrU family lipid kinase
MKTLIIVNKTAAKARRVWPLIQKQLDAAGVHYDAYETKTSGDATTAARQALHNGINTIACVGGDGTLSEAAEGFFEFNADPALAPTIINPTASLAILPAGTGDDFARGFGGRRAVLREFIDTLVSHCCDASDRSRLVDVLYGRCDGFEKPFICLNASTMGIGGETAGRVAAQGKFMRNFSGEFRFLSAAVGALAAWRERRVRVTVDGQVTADGPMNLVVVSNAPYAGGGMMFSPIANLDDGKLDVLTASGLSRAEVIYELSRVHKGEHLKNPKVNVTQGEIVKIETLLLQDAMPLEVDGNVRGVTPVQFQVLPAALRFLV